MAKSQVKQKDQTAEQTTELVVTKLAPLPVATNQEIGPDAFEEDAGVGFGGVGVQDLAIPFITILQSGSPQLKRGETKVEGAEEGDIYSTVTGAVYKGTEGIYVIPCTYKKAYVEWKSRDAGGGFVRQHESPEILDETQKDAKGSDIMPNGNLIVTTAYHYVLLVDSVSGDYIEGVISMTSTQLKKSRKWNSVMNSLKMTRKDGTKFTPAMFSHLYRLTTEPESNELGAWSGWKIEIVSQTPTIDLYAAAKKFAIDINKGLIKEPTPLQTATGDDPIPY